MYIELLEVPIADNDHVAKFVHLKLVRGLIDLSRLVDDLYSGITYGPWEGTDRTALCENLLKHVKGVVRRVIPLLRGGGVGSERQTILNKLCQTHIFWDELGEEHPLHDPVEWL